MKYGERMLSPLIFVVVALMEMHLTTSVFLKTIFASLEMNTYMS